MIHQIDIEYYGCMAVLILVGLGLVWLCFQIIGDLVNEVLDGPSEVDEFEEMAGKQI